MIRITKWRPDTCGCEVDYEWDDTVSQDERVHTAVATIKCAEHDGVDDDNVTIYDTVLEENQRKNRTLGQLLEDAPADLKMTVINPNTGEETQKFKPNKEPKWSFTQDRSLEIELPTEFSKNNKDTIKAKLDQAHGEGKVKFK